MFTVGWGVFTTIAARYAGRLGELALAFGKIQGFVGGMMLGIFYSRSLVAARALSAP
jgi:hypothetical protein